MEWTRSELKEKAKFSVRSFYWKSVLVAFILMLVSGGFTGGRDANGGETQEITGNQFIDSIGGRYAGMLMLVLGLAAIAIFFVVIAGVLLSLFVFSPL